MLVYLSEYGDCHVHVQYEPPGPQRKTKIVVDTPQYKEFMDAESRNHSGDPFSKFIGKREALKKLGQKYNLPKQDRFALFEALLKKGVERMKNKK